LEAFSRKEKAVRERDERGAVKAAEREPKQEEKEANRTTWTTEDDEAIMSVIVGGSTYAEIALALGKGQKWSDISKRWNQKLKESISIIKPKIGKPNCTTWTAEDN
jgi:hypothetical protein